MLRLHLLVDDSGHDMSRALRHAQRFEQSARTRALSRTVTTTTTSSFLELDLSLGLRSSHAMLCSYLFPVAICST